MRNILTRLWNDDDGSVVATEWVFVATILVLGTVSGLVALRQMTSFELTEAQGSPSAHHAVAASPAGR